MIDWIFHAIEEIVDAYREIAFPDSRKFLLPAAILIVLAAILRPISAATGLGIHPDRILKLMVSTNILPTWTEQQGLKSKDCLKDALVVWKKECNGAFS